MADSKNNGIYQPAYPYQKLLDFRKTEWGEGFSRFELTLRKEHQNFAKLPHGGVYASLLDSSLGSAGVYMGNDTDIRPAVTLNLNISFVAAPKSILLIAQGRVVGGGKSVFFAEGDIRDGIGNLIATATGTYKYVAARSAKIQSD